MKTLQQREYISIQQGCQQLKLEICGGREYKAEKDEFYRQVSAQLEELDYHILCCYATLCRFVRCCPMQKRTQNSPKKTTCIFAECVII